MRSSVYLLEAEVRELGYKPYGEPSQYKSLYSMGDVTLAIRDTGKNVTAELSFVCGHLIVSTGHFRFPNVNFRLFEKEIFTARTVLKEAISDS